jgi:VanZ family protein
MRKACLAAGWGWAAAIAWLSLTPAPPEVDIEHGYTLGHFASYGLLMFWFSQLYPKKTTRVAYAIGFVAMGIGLEFLQGALGFRTYDAFDMYANALGVLLGWAAALALRKPLFH